MKFMVDFKNDPAEIYERIHGIFFERNPWRIFKKKKTRMKGSLEDFV